MAAHVSILNSFETLSLYRPTKTRARTITSAVLKGLVPQNSNVSDDFLSSRSFKGHRNRYIPTARQVYLNWSFRLASIRPYN